MSEFKHKGINYNIISETSGKAEMMNWEVKITDHTKIKEIFAWHPWWINNKWRWFKKIKIKFQLEIVRYSDFDSGWSYRDYWKPWNLRWESIEIL